MSASTFVNIPSYFSDEIVVRHALPMASAPLGPDVAEDHGMADEETVAGPTETDLEIAYLLNRVITDREAAAKREYELDRELTNALTRAQTARQRHESDIIVIQTALHEVAERQEWCGEFEQFIAQANRDLHIELEGREKDYAVTYTISVTSYVRARNEDEATEIAEEYSSNAANVLVNRVSGVDAAEVDSYSFSADETD